MGQGKQEVYFSEHCLQEGVSISRVLQALIGDVDPSSDSIAESDSGSPSNQLNQAQQTDAASSQAASACASELISHKIVKYSYLILTILDIAKSIKCCRVYLSLPFDVVKLV
jgi:hypothetical protein